MNLLPEPPTDDEVYSYFGGRSRWPFVYLFLAQCALTYGFVRVMIKSPATLIGLTLLTFSIPPMVVNVWLRTRRHRSSLDVHKQLLSLGRGLGAGRSVDVFLPTCGEDLAVLENTMAHVARLTWSGPLEVHVLDDKASKSVKRLAKRHGFNYVVRADRGYLKKAGNLINAFNNSDGEFVVVFDADFVPRPDFLEHVFPYMLDERVGVVQTAQFFETEDRRFNYFARHAGILQEMFFRWIQPARDSSRAAICAGTNVMYRRSAVASVGGFAEVPIGEDVHSGIKVWGGSFETRYVPLCLAKGLAPDSWKALTNQQYRWCRSSMLLMVGSSFRRSPLGVKQRVCFWAAFLYYLSSATIVLIGPAPGLLMIWLHPQQIHLTNYLPLVPAFLGTAFVLPRCVSGWGLGIIRVCMVNSFCHLLAVVDALRGRVEEWVPTGSAGDASDRARLASLRTSRGCDLPTKVARLFRGWLLVTQALLWSGLGVEIARDGFSMALLPLMALGLLQLVFLGPLAVTLRPVELRGGGARATSAPLSPRAVPVSEEASLPRELATGSGPTAIPHLSGTVGVIDLRTATPETAAVVPAGEPVVAVAHHGSLGVGPTLVPALSRLGLPSDSRVLVAASAGPA